MQNSSTSQLIFSPAFLIAYISQVITLEVGDVIYTGTPSGVGIARKPQRFLQPGILLKSKSSHWELFAIHASQKALLRLMQAVLLLSPLDTVVIALRPIEAGESVRVASQQLTINQNIPAGHKISIVKTEVDQAVIKFGWSIGTATKSIHPGDHVHSHNLRCEHTIDLSAICTEIPESPPPLDYTFQGFQRAAGKVGTRNYVAVISNVNCSASVAKMIARRFEGDVLKAFPNVDGVIAFRHEGGCAMAYQGSRHNMLTRVLGGIARHPNIGGFLLVGLGCEQGTLDHLVESQRLHSISLPGDSSSKQNCAVPVLSMQSLGGTRLTVERGVEEVAKLLKMTSEAKRETVSASNLILGTNCGGSDGYSGITANPALGIASDLIVACGGTSILAETSEIYGAEQLLTRRARNPAVAHKLLERIEWWKKYCGSYGEDSTITLRSETKRAV